MRVLFFRNKMSRIKLEKSQTQLIFSLQQLLTYCNRKYTVMVQNYEFLTLKFVLINQGESSRKLPMFAGKNL